MKTQDRPQVESIITHRGEFFRVLQQTTRTLITIPAGANHHVLNPGAAPLFFLTVYAPPEY